MRNVGPENDISGVTEVHSSLYVNHLITYIKFVLPKVSCNIYIAHRIHLMDAVFYRHGVDPS